MTESNDAEIGEKLDDVEIIARYVGGAHVDSGTGRVNGSAFDRTLKDRDGLSFTRRNIFSLDEAADRAAIRRVVGSHLTFGKTAIFVEIPVGEASEALAEFGQPVAVHANPLPKDGDKLANPAHALLIGLPFSGEEVGSLKSELAGDRLKRRIVATFPAIVAAVSNPPAQAG